MSSVPTSAYSLPIAGQIWPSPIGAQASADFDQALSDSTEEASEVLFGSVVAAAQRTQTATA